MCLNISSAFIILYAGIVLFCGTSCIDREVHEFSAELLYHYESETCNAALWYPDRKSLFWVDTNQKKIFEYIPAKDTCNSWSFDYKVGCVVPETNNTVILALENRIVRYHLDNKYEELIAPIDDENGKLRCNDGKCSPNGNLWVGTVSHTFEKGAGSAHCVHPDGNVSRMFKGLTTSNGLVWSGDKKFMYHNDAPSGFVKRYRYDIKTEGVIHNGAAVMIPKEIGTPEGITIDKNDNLWIPQKGGFGVYCYNPYTGQLVARVSIPTPNATSCAFGGENLDTLFITTSRYGLTEEDLIKYPLSGSIFACKIAPIGVEAFYFGEKKY